MSNSPVLLIVIFPFYKPKPLVWFNIDTETNVGGVAQQILIRISSTSKSVFSALFVSF